MAGSLPTSMRAWRVHNSSNDLTQWTLEEVPVPPLPPPPGYFLAKVYAASLNPVDYKIAGILTRFPYTPGLDGAGVVVALGDGVTRFHVGDRVTFHTWFRDLHGTFAEYALVKEVSAVSLPPSIRFADAAAYPCAAWTAYLALGRMFAPAPVAVAQPSSERKTIVITAASGAVGAFAVQLCKYWGLRVVAVASPGRQPFLRDLGVDEFIDSSLTGEALSSAMLACTGGRGADYALDCLSADSAAACLRGLRFCGQLCCVAGVPTLRAADAQHVFTRSLSLHTVSLGMHYGEGTPDQIARIAELGRDVTDLAAAGVLRPLVCECLRLEQVAAALGRLRDRTQVQPGKMVVVIADE